MADGSAYESLENPTYTEIGPKEGASDSAPKDEVVRIDDTEDTEGNEGKETSDAGDEQRTEDEGQMKDAPVLDEVGSIGSKNSRKSMVTDTISWPSKRDIRREESYEMKRIRREKKYEREKKARELADMREKQAREREWLYGKFSSEIGWRVILSFIVFCFAISVAACTLVALIFAEARQFRATPKDHILEKINRQTSGILTTIDETYEQLKDEMNELEGNVTGDNRNVMELIHEHSANLSDKFCDHEDDLLERIDLQSTNITERIEDQEDMMERKFENQTEELEEKLQDQHVESYKMVVGISGNIGSMFTALDETIQEYIKNTEYKLMNKTEKLGLLLGTELDDIESSADEDFSVAKREFVSELSAIRGELGDKISDALTSIQARTQGDFGNLADDVDDVEEGIGTKVNTVTASTTARAGAQDDSVQAMINSAIFDITNYTETVRDGLSDTVEDSIKETKTAMEGKITNLNTMITNSETRMVQSCTGLGTSMEAAVQALAPAMTTAEGKVTLISTNTGTGIDNLKTGIENAFTAVARYEVPESCAEVHFTALAAEDLDDDSGEQGGAVTLAIPAYFPDGLKVFCSALDDGGWMVIQRNQDTSSAAFSKNFAAYQNKFGDFVDSNYWFGLLDLHKVTTSAEYYLKIELTQNDDTVIKFIYRDFKVGSLADDFPLTIGNFLAELSDTLPAGSSDFTAHDTKTFSTADHGSAQSCATQGGGGWWFISTSTCQTVKLNGNAYASIAALSTNTDGIWMGNQNNYYKKSVMSIKLKGDPVLVFEGM